MSKIYIDKYMIKISNGKCDRKLLVFRTTSDARKAFVWCNKKGLSAKQATKALLDRADELFRAKVRTEDGKEKVLRSSKLPKTFGELGGRRTYLVN